MIKKSSQTNYKNNFIRYAYWCYINETTFIQFPIDHYQIATYLIDEISKGLAPSTIRGKKAAIGWWYNIWQQKNSKFYKKEGMYDPDHPVLLSVQSYSYRINIKNPTLPAKAWKRQHLFVLYNKYGIFIDNDFICLTILLLSVVTANRIHMLIPYHPFISDDTIQGLKPKDIFILYDNSFDNDLMNKIHGICVPFKFWNNIVGIRIKYIHSKTTQTGMQFYKFIGKTNKNIDVVIMCLRIFNYYNNNIQHKITKNNTKKFLFVKINGEPITYNFYNKWIHKRRKLFATELGDLGMKRLRTHSGRKTFVTILEKIGYSETRIAKYTGWRSKSMMNSYLDIEQSEMLNVAHDIFYKSFLFGS